MHTDQSDRRQARPSPPGRSPSDTARPAAPADPLVGRLLDRRYRIGERIARGGMASIYEATDIRLDRTVAVKVMHAGMGDDEEFAARFVREARAAARLSHPHVVSVFDQGDDDGVVYLAMELVEGHTLRDTVSAEAPMAPARALALLEPVLSALAAAHRAGVVHRDVKPENVLIADDGRVKVADFGLAKAVSADTQHTTRGVLIGTVSYLAPELVVEGRCDARADVYAAGVMLYELLTGEKPHAGETPIQVAYKHVHHDVPAPSATRPGLPAYVDALVARATARDRSRRPADATVLLHQVHRVAQALAEGVHEDAELEADLRPSPAPAPDEEPAGSEQDPVAAAHDTAPQVYDSAEMGQLFASAPPVPGRDAPPTAAAAPESALAPPSPDGREHTTLYGADTPDPPPQSPAAAPSRSRRRRRGALVLVLALVLALGAGGGAYWFGWARYTSAPGVIGMSQGEAAERLTATGLELAVADETYSETVPEGAVIETDPAAGARILAGGTVSAVVSLGKERYDVPALRGRELDQAQDALLRRTLRQDEVVERFSETFAEGTVMRTRPEAGTTLRPGSPVDLVVSKGRRPIQVGDWVGGDYDEAVAALEKRGLDPVLSSETYDDTVPAGDVISQDPGSGTLFRGDAVSFVVSLGPELVEVPGVRAYGIEAATDELEALGLEVDVANDEDYIGLGFVLRTDPGAGEMVPVGSTITLTII